MKIIDDTLMNELAEKAKKSPRLRMNYNSQWKESADTGR